jgi:hypothetical protein
MHYSKKYGNIQPINTTNSFFKTNYPLLVAIGANATWKVKHFNDNTLFQNIALELWRSTWIVALWVRKLKVFSTTNYLRCLKTALEALISISLN